MAVDNRNFVNTFANEGGADVLVEDKRMDELKGATPQTSSQISTTAQYIPLQDTDGNLVKINPSSFEDAVRNVLGTLLANNDKGVTISSIPALSGGGSSIDFGSISPVNLASVLGGLNKPLVNKTGTILSAKTGENIIGTIGISIVTVTCNNGMTGFTTWICGRGNAIKLLESGDVGLYFSCSMDGFTLKVISSFSIDASIEVCTIPIEYY